MPSKKRGAEKPPQTREEVETQVGTREFPFMLSEGREITLRKIGWKRFRALMDELTKILPEKEAGEVARNLSAGKVTGLSADMVEKIVLAGSPLTESDFEDLAFDDMLGIATRLVMAQLVDNEAMQGFFLLVVSILRSAGVENAAPNLPEA